MFSWFSEKPKSLDREYADLAQMLTLTLTPDHDNQIYRQEELNPAALDFSLESLKHIDNYLEKLHADPPQGHDLLRVVLRTGAYVGEVMKKQRPGKYHWIAYEEAAKRSDVVKNLELSLATIAILWYDKNSGCFPLGKVCNYIQNGSEDSVYFFAYALLQLESN